MNKQTRRTHTYIYIWFSLDSFSNRKTSTVQSWLLNASIVDGQSHSTIPMSIKQSRRKDYLHEILPSQSMQQRGSKVNKYPSSNILFTYRCFLFKRWRSNNNTHSIDLRRLLSFGSANRDHIHRKSLLIMTFFFTIFVRIWIISFFSLSLSELIFEYFFKV